MKSTRFAALAVVVVASAVCASAARAVEIDVTPASAPNAFGSPSYTQWEQNAVAAIESGASTFGTPGTPTYYSAYANGATINVLDNVVTGFPSWHGQANPASPFQSELGNRLAFGLHIDGQGTQFSISQLSFNAVSTDPTNSLGFGFGLGSYNYGTGYVGLNYGADGMKGTGDDFFVTGGSNTQLVNELFGRGSGNAWDIYDTDPGATRQDKINGVYAKFAIGNDPFSFTGTYTLGADTGSATINFAGGGLAAPAAPLPASAWAGLALLGTVFGWRKWAGREGGATA